AWRWLAWRSTLLTVELQEVLVEHPPAKLLAHRRGGELRVFAFELAPRLVGCEQHPVVAHAAALDVGQQPARREADRPAGVGVDLVALLDPVEEPGYQPDVAAHAAAEVDQVDLHPLPVPLDEGDEVGDVRVAAGTRVEVEGQVMALRGGEARLRYLLGLLVPSLRVGVAAE